MKKYSAFPKNATHAAPVQIDPVTHPVLARHWGDGERQPSTFAQQAAASAFGRNWSPAADDHFVDRPPGPIAHGGVEEVAISAADKLIDIACAQRGRAA